MYDPCMQAHLSRRRPLNRKIRAPTSVLADGFCVRVKPKFRATRRVQDHTALKSFVLRVQAARKTKTGPRYTLSQSVIRPSPLPPPPLLPLDRSRHDQHEDGDTEGRTFAFPITPALRSSAASRRALRSSDSHTILCERCSSGTVPCVRPTSPCCALRFLVAGPVCPGLGTCADE